MADNSFNIKALESLVTGIKEITGCRIETDAGGRILEVHVTAVSDRPPRLIARDVDTLLKVKGGVDIDHRKIQVAMLKPEEERGGDAASTEDAPAFVAPLPEPPAASADPTAEPAAAAAPAPAGEEPDAEGPELIVIEDAGEEERVLFERLDLSHSQGLVSVSVTLRRGARCEVGEHETADSPAGNLDAVIKATLEAMLLLHESEMQFAAPGFDRVRFGHEEVLVVHLAAVENREVISFTGSAVVRQDPRQAAVLATLSALNRLTGLWPLRDELEFEIE
jgi:hypothetical protein